MTLQIKLFFVFLAISMAFALPAKMDEEPFCDIVCAAVYHPICGGYGYTQKTFSNDCYMNIESCQTRTPFTKLHDGECQGDKMAVAF